MNKEVEEYRELIVKVLAELDDYEESGHKTTSARIRKCSLQIGKLGASLRRTLIKLDKKKK